MAASLKFSPLIETFWRFAVERQNIFYRRLAGAAEPWTGDPILQHYRFTNAYRASDRVSQYLIGEVQYRPDRPTEGAELFFRTLLFKIFNRIETWETLEAALGPITWADTGLDRIERALDRMRAGGQPIYSAAYIMPSPALGQQRKHANHLALLRRMMGDRLPDRLREAHDLQSVYALLLGYPGIGRFLAFQYAIDLNYSALLAFSEEGFVVAGPGAIDGISKCTLATGSMTAEDVIRAVTDLQDEAFGDLGLAFRRLGHRRLQPIDCQNLFCEVSKYTRMSHPGIAGVSGRTRIKQVFRRNQRPLAAYVFPPRWGIDLRLPPHIPTPGPNPHGGA